MASMNHLAEDLIFQILSWLPVLSLLRCKSVCKSWKSIISNPKFIQAHLAISQKKQHPFSTLRVVSRSDESQDLFMDTLGENSVKLSLPRYISDVRAQLLIRSCNGLVILGDIFFVFLYIWNPLMRMDKLLPLAHYVRLGVVNKIGFGFDPLSSDYKILRVVFGRLSDLLDNGEKKDGIVAELYSFNANSWKPIQVPKEMQGFKFDPISECVCVDSRVLCLPGTDGILSFDLQDEVFRMHKYPASGEIISEVLDFEGSIALILRSGERASVLTLWALDEVDGNLWWTEKFNIEPAERIAYVLIYLGDGKFVARDHSHACFFYDMKKGTFVDQFRIYMPVVQFQGSLLSLKGFEPQG